MTDKITSVEVILQCKRREKSLEDDINYLDTKIFENGLISGKGKAKKPPVLDYASALDIKDKNPYDNGY